ncbi:MAG: glycoside hydrolase family 16 protein [Prolixibacteraceae bacterium]|nr:glycoside hydrolase family 16 protein [Prolixibacteraceae bacterium]
MKRIFLITYLISSIILKCWAQQVPLPDCSYDEGPFYLVFEDEFEGNALDETKWIKRKGHLRNYDKEIQMYQHENIVVEDGKLKLWAKKEPSYGPCRSGEKFGIPYDSIIQMGYSAGEINSRRTFLYGKFEAKMTYHYGQQFWPAFWLYGNTGERGQMCEIDIIEVFSDDGRYTVHNKERIPGEWTLRPSYYFPLFYDLSSTYAMVWTPYKIEFYYDNVKIKTIYHFNENGRNIKKCSDNLSDDYEENNWVYPVPCKILLNFAINIKDMQGSPDRFLPNCFEVDYVKVWQRVPDFEVNGRETMQIGNTLSEVYSVPFIEGADYSWSIPDGWAGSSSRNEITLQPNGSDGGTITVTLTFLDGQQISRSKEVRVITPKPLKGKAY